MKLYWPTFTLSLRVCLLCAEERLAWRCFQRSDERLERGAVEFVIVIERRCYVTISLGLDMSRWLFHNMLPCWWWVAVFTVVAWCCCGGGCSWEKGGVRMGARVVMLRRGKICYGGKWLLWLTVVTVADCGCFWIEFNFRLRRVHLFFRWNMDIGVILCSWWKRFAPVWCIWLLLCWRWRPCCSYWWLCFVSILMKEVDDFVDKVDVGIFQVEFKDCAVQEWGCLKRSGYYGSERGSAKTR